MTNEQIFEISYRWRKGQDSFDIAKKMELKESDVEIALFKYVIRPRRRRAA
ncbi:hypothetical protein [Hyphomicrobium sp. ghe19]|uniref:hypothetical protein n=1 Tax=Hyphomicrobium sp. ghe19 TaxID=2682968 RepID=UPI001366AAD1|nr:hypothetical protein HYPP_01501 [Hyphomicrobium sp. ghe19]